MAVAGKCLINARNLGVAIEEWASLPKVKKTFRNPYEAAFRLVETEFLMPLNDIALREVDVTKGQVESFKLRLKQLNESIDRGKLGNSFATNMYQTSHYGKKDPIIGSVLRKSQRTEFYTKAAFTTNKTLMQQMMKDIESESIQRGILNVGGFAGRKAQREMKKMDDMLQQEIVKYKNGEEPNTSKISEVQNKIDKLISENYLQVYEDLRYVIEKDLGRLELEAYKKLSVSDKEKVV